MPPLAVDPVALDGAGRSLLATGKDLVGAIGALSGALTANAGMCGNDPAGIVHGRQYDTSAKSLVEAMVDLTNGANRIGDGIRLSAANYSKAEVASNVGGASGPPLRLAPARAGRIRRHRNRNRHHNARRWCSCRSARCPSQRDRGDIGQPVG
jgi:hypothetical protein